MHVLITGASAGIGRALALDFANNGARLTLGRDVRFEGARLEGPADRRLRRRFRPRY